MLGFLYEIISRCTVNKTFKKTGSSISKGRPSLAVILTSNLHVTSVCFTPQHVTTLLSLA